MWDDIKMWLYLRLLHAELDCHIPLEIEGETEKWYGSLCCEVRTDKRFRNKENFMKKVQSFGPRIFLAFLPFPLHGYLLRGHPKTEEKVTERTKAIFGSAEDLKYFQFPIKKEVEDFYAYPIVEKLVEDKDIIAISYEQGNRFISWSGLFKFLYDNHWQFIAFLWAVILYALGHLLGFWAWVCQTYPNIPMC